jgi:hypothetical protein
MKRVTEFILSTVSVTEVDNDYDQKLNKSLFQTQLQMCAPFGSSSYLTLITN